MPPKIKLDPERRPWDQQPGEAAKHYHDFQYYLRQEPESRTIRAAALAKYGEKEFTKHRGDFFLRKSMWFRWVERSIAYDMYLAELDRVEWEKRRREVKEMDYQQSMSIRRLYDKVLATAEDFIAENKTFIQGRDGEPAKEIINRKIDVAQLIKALEVASKLGRLATGEATSNIHINMRSIDALIQQEIAKLANGGDDPDEEIDGEEAEYDFSDEIDDIDLESLETVDAA